MGLIVSTVGESDGDSFGAGNSMQQLSSREVHKVDHLSKPARLALDATVENECPSEMTMQRSPAMSVALVAPDHYETIRKTVEHLRAQTVRDELEIIIVAPSAEKLGLDLAELQDFCQFRMIEAGEIGSTGAAIALGIRHASAPVVAYAEEHSYPDPGWAAALIEAHQQPWAGVGVVMANANPGSLVSWANFFLDFGPWAEPSAGGERDRLPWHHTAYKRALLLAYGHELESMLETEGILHNDLRAKGYRLYLERAATAQHVNLSLLSSFIRAEFHGGRLFGAARAKHERWSAFRRLLYAGGWPLIPLVRFQRVLRDIRRTDGERALLPRLVPLLVTGLVAHAIGEAVGYAFNAGAAAQRRCTFELERYRHVAQRDRPATAARCRAAAGPS